MAVSGLVTPVEWVADYVELLLDARSRFRSRKHWEDADRIRSGLEKLGVTLQGHTFGHHLDPGGTGKSVMGCER